MSSLICIRTSGWVHNRDTGDLRRQCAYYDVTVMWMCSDNIAKSSLKFKWEGEWCIAMRLLSCKLFIAKIPACLWSVKHYAVRPHVRKSVSWGIGGIMITLCVEFCLILKYSIYRLVPCPYDNVTSYVKGVSELMQASLKKKIPNIHSNLSVRGYNTSKSTQVYNWAPIAT